MTTQNSVRRPGTKYGAADKVARIPVKIVPSETHRIPRKPKWIRSPFPIPEKAIELRRLLRSHNLHTVCEEAKCPNLGECFEHGTATFMVMGDICTRRCPYCDVAHGRPLPIDGNEPERLASVVATLRLNYVVITSVDRDDLRDGGARHFCLCVAAVRRSCPGARIETLVPDFAGRMELAVETLSAMPPDVISHNIETVPRLYRQVRPGGNYGKSLRLLRMFQQRLGNTPTKSGIMLGLGETLDEVKSVMGDLCENGVSLLTIGQYLQPTKYHLPIHRYVMLQEFDDLREFGTSIGFTHVASGPMVRSSYHAEIQYKHVTDKSERCRTD